MPKTLALTIGEPAGIRPDLTLAVWRQRSQLSLPPFYVLGDAPFLARRAKLLRLDLPVALVEEMNGPAVQPVMLLWCPELAVVPVTIHLPLKDVPGALTTDLLVRTGRI